MTADKSIDRRDFLAGAALLAVAATVATAPSAKAVPLEGEALRATPIFDINAHLSEAPPKIAAGNDVGYDVARDLAHRKSVMARWGIRRTVLMAPYIFDMAEGPADTHRQNDYVAWYCQAHRDLFPVGVGGVQPAQGQEAGIAEIRRMKNALGLAGLMFHPEYTGGIAGARMVAFAKECANLKMPVLIHMEITGGSENGIDMEALARRVPECTFVALGGFGAHSTARELRGAAKSCPNVLFDTSYCHPMSNHIAEFASVCGSERILFGSCMESTNDTYIYPAGYYDILYGNDLTEEDRQNILWKNAHRLFGLT